MSIALSALRQGRRVPAGRSGAIALAVVFALLAAAALTAPQAPARAEEPINLMGEWIVRPFDWRSGAMRGCRYRQSIDIEKRVGPGRYEGRSISGFTCNSVRFGDTVTPLVIEVDGKTVILKSPQPTWFAETLKYISPYRMDGKDAIGHRMIYERPKGPPTS